MSIHKCGTKDIVGLPFNDDSMTYVDFPESDQILDFS